MVSVLILAEADVFRSRSRDQRNGCFSGRWDGLGDRQAAVGDSVREKRG